MIRAAERIMGLVSQRQIALNLAIQETVMATLVTITIFQQVTLSICGSNNFDVSILALLEQFFFILFIFVKQDKLFELFATTSLPMQGNPDSGIREIIACEIRNPRTFCSWNPES